MLTLSRDFVASPVSTRNSRHCLYSAVSRPILVQFHQAERRGVCNWIRATIPSRSKAGQGLVMIMMMIKTWQEEASWFVSSQDSASCVFPRPGLSARPAACLFASPQTNSRSFVCFSRNSRCLFRSSGRRGIQRQRQLLDCNSQWCSDQPGSHLVHLFPHCNHCNQQSAPLCSGNRCLSWYWYCNHCNHFYSQRPPRFDYYSRWTQDRYQGASCPCKYLFK